MELNGKTYEMQYLTDEETAVINAMRKGASIEATFYNSDETRYRMHCKTLGHALPHQKETDCSKGDGPRFISYTMQNSEYAPTVRINHFHHAEKAAE